MDEFLDKHCEHRLTLLKQQMCSFFLLLKHIDLCVVFSVGRGLFKGSQADCGDPAERSLLQR